MICTHAALLVQPLKEETIQDECLGHLKQFHEFCLIIAEGFKEERYAFTHLTLGAVQNGLYGAYVLAVPMLADVVTIVR